MRDAFLTFLVDADYRDHLFMLENLWDGVYFDLMEVCLLCFICNSDEYTM